MKHMTMYQLLLLCSDDDDRDNDNKHCDPIRDFYWCYTCTKVLVTKGLLSALTKATTIAMLLLLVGVAWCGLVVAGAMTTTETSEAQSLLSTGYIDVVPHRMHKRLRASGLSW